MKSLRSLSSFVKSKTPPTNDEFSLIKSKLLNSEWHLQDEFMSSSNAKQMYVTLQSLLCNSHISFMDQFNANSLECSIEGKANDIFKKGLPLPPGYTLAYCNPLSYERDLGSDGYDNYHAPILNNVEFFKRRMWVNGSFTFNIENPLFFGSPVFFKEKVSTIRYLRRSNMIFTNYNREFSNADGLSVKESRGLCYMEDLFNSNPNKTSISHEIPDKTVVVTPSILTNFRMSAITFNSHLIHYNPVYAKTIENYDDTVIEAPLLISLALQFWRNNNPEKSIRQFTYKIITPTYANNRLSINYRHSGSSVKLWISNENSFTCFDSTIEL